MNVARFNFALSHEDPDVVKQGLDAFRTQILQDHGAVLSFGYNGREGGFGGSSSPPMGLLATFLRSSPQLEELFVLWGLPGRDEDRALSASHMSCLAAILHCARHSESLCDEIVNRILHEYNKKIISQLGSGSISLVHATLGLVLAMARTSPLNARNIYSKLLIIGISTLSTLLQRGKTVTWENPETKEKMTTDSRLLIAMVIIVVLQSADATIMNDLLSPGSLLRRVTNAIHKDSLEGLRIILNGLSSCLKQADVASLMGNAKQHLVDSQMQQRLLELYRSEDAQTAELVHSFLADYCLSLSKAIGKRTASSARGAAVQLAQQLEPHTTPRHKEV